MTDTYNKYSRRDPLLMQHNDRYYHYRSFSTQPRPHRAPLPYTRAGGTSNVSRTGWETRLKPIKSGEYGTFPTEGIEWSIGLKDPDSYSATAFNKALNKVEDKLRTADSFFEDWYERQQAVNLLKTVGKELFTFVFNWRKKSYWTALAKERRPKDLPSAWLAYQFGIKPLVSGVDRAMNLLSAEFPILHISGSSSDKLVRKLGPLFAQNHAYPYLNSSVGTTYTKIGCYVTGFNPNSALSGATGLNEPFSSVWNVLPWGWAIDYFYNVGELLSNFENRHPGLVTEGWYVTRFGKTKVSSKMNSAAIKKWTNSMYNGKDVYSSIMSSYSYSFTGDYYYMNRVIYNRPPDFKSEFKFPPLGGTKQANLFSAIAMTMSSASKRK